MPLDVNRIAQAVAEAVLEDQGSKRPAQQPPRKHKLITTPRALLLGAGLFTAGRLVVGPRARDLVGNLQDRLVEFERSHLTDDGEDPEGEGDFDDDEEFEDEEPEAEVDEEPEYEDEPEDEYDEDEEPEGEYDEEEEPEGEYDEEEAEEEPSRSASR